MRNLVDAIVSALKKRAIAHGVSAEVEHRRILEQEPLRRRSFAEVLSQMPDVGEDADFDRVRESGLSNDVFN